MYIYFDTYDMAFVYPLFIANQKIELILVFFLCYEVTDLSAEPKPKPSNQGSGVYYNLQVTILSWREVQPLLINGIHVSADPWPHKEAEL